MRKYELTLVLATKTTEAKKKAVGEKVTKLIEEGKGKVGKVEGWEKEGAGSYMLFPVELEAESAKSLSSKLKVEKEIEKYLLVRA